MHFKKLKKDKAYYFINMKYKRCTITSSFNKQTKINKRYTSHFIENIYAPIFMHFISGSIF